MAKPRTKTEAEELPTYDDFLADECYAHMESDGFCWVNCSCSGPCYRAFDTVGGIDITQLESPCCGRVWVRD